MEQVSPGEQVAESLRSSHGVAGTQTGALKLNDV
jgi:hypothetical protein